MHLKLQYAQFDVDLGQRTQWKEREVCFAVKNKDSKQKKPCMLYTCTPSQIKYKVSYLRDPLTMQIGKGISYSNVRTGLGTTAAVTPHYSYLCSV